MSSETRKLPTLRDIGEPCRIVERGPYFRKRGMLQSMTQDRAWVVLGNGVTAVVCLNAVQIILDK